VAGLWRRVREGYWAIPAICVLGAAAVASALVQIDRGLQQRGFALVFAGGPDSARSLLSTISTSMLSLTALTFSITMVVLQLASSQFSPRAMATFLQDRQNQLTLGVFLATYVYALLALREIRGTEAPVDQFVPGLTIGTAFVLVLVSIGFFVAYIHHIARSIQVSSIVQRIEAQTRRAMEGWIHDDEAAQQLADLPDGDRHARAGPPEPQTRRTVAAACDGVLAGVDAGRLVRTAQECGVLVEVLARPGEFLPAGAPLLVVHGALRPGPVDDGDEQWLGAVHQVGRRDDLADVTLGLRQLVDITERALSPGLNDPSTAAQCLDRLHGLLRRLAAAPYPSELHRDGDGQLRLIAPQLGWDDHVAMVLDEVRLWGAGSLQVRRTLQRMVDDLLVAAPGDRRQPLLDRLPLFDAPLPIGSV
jgi:uncharacterized membrane protein